MAKEFDRVKFSIPDAPGTGTVTVGTRSDSSFFLPTEQGAVDGDNVYYVIQKSNKDTEIGIGTVASGATEVTRDTVMSSIISGTAGTSKINIDASAFMAFVTPAHALESLRVVRTVTGATDAFADNDGMGSITYNRATAIAVTLPQAGASSKLLKGWFAFVSNVGAGTVTITPTTSTINGATTLVLPQNLGAMIVSDGTNYHAYIMPLTKPLLAANNLSDVANAGTALTNLGGTTVGKSVFTAADAVAGRVALGISQMTALGASQNFNLVVAPGTYYTIDGSSTNAPVAGGTGFYYLTVEVYGVAPTMFMKQTATGLDNNPGVTWVRVMVSGTWGAWRRVFAFGDQLPGTTTNDNASAGNVGEFVESETFGGTAVALTSSVAANITSISLTAGDWDVWGAIAIEPGARSSSILISWINTVSATQPANPNKGAALQTAGGGALNMSVPVGLRRLSLASTTTVYLSTLVVFTGAVGLPAYGYIGARRVR